MTTGESIFRDEDDSFYGDSSQQQTARLFTIAEEIFAGKPGDIYFSKLVQFPSDVKCELTSTEEALLVNGSLLELTTDQAFNIHDSHGTFAAPNREERTRYHRDNNGFMGLKIDTPSYAADIKVYSSGLARMDVDDKDQGASSRNAEVREGYLGAAIFCLEVMGLPQVSNSSTNPVDWVIDEFRQPGHHIKHGDDLLKLKDPFAVASDETKRQFLDSGKRFIGKQDEGLRFIQKASLEWPDGELMVKRSYPVNGVKPGEPRIEVEYKHAAPPGSRFDQTEGYLRCGSGERDIWYEAEIYDLALMAAKAKEIRGAALEPQELIAAYQNYAKQAEARLRHNTAKRDTLREDVALGYWGLCQGGLTKVIGLLEGAK